MNTLATTPALSIAMVVGNARDRARLALEALAAQEVDGGFELVLVDCAPAEVPPLPTPEGVRAVTSRLPGEDRWAVLRCSAARLARAPVVAFIEDHCRALPGWAQAVVDAHRGPWVAVGYAFTNGSRSTWADRSAWFAEYGFWAHPTPGGEAGYLPGNNVAYKREALLAASDDMERAFAVDFNLQTLLRRQGGRLFIEPRALVAHQTYERFAPLLVASIHYARLMTANRVMLEGWGWGRRIASGVLAPVLVPPLRILRLARALLGRRALWPTFIASLPVVAICFTAAAIGEALGSVFGEGQSGIRLTRFEIEIPRADGQAELGRRSPDHTSG